LGRMWRADRSTGVTSMPGRVTEAPVVTQATLRTDVLPTGFEQAASAGTMAASAKAAPVRARAALNLGRTRPRRGGR
jgi:hypothetical protein